MIGDELVTRGRSAFYVRDGSLCVGIAGALAVAQLVCLTLGWTDGPWFPFGLLVPCAALIGVAIIGYGHRAWCCRACMVGLEPGWYVEVSVAAETAVLDAVRHDDPLGVVAAVTEHPRAPREPFRRLWLDRCPSCGQVALVVLERETRDPGAPPRRAWDGPGVVALLAVADLDLG